MSSLAVAMLAAPDDPPNPWFSWSYVQQNTDSIREALIYHVSLTARAVALAALVAIPLSIIAYWFRPLAAPIVGFSNVVYTIPSLALVALLAPYTGVTGTTTILIVLVLYALMLIVQNALTSLRQIPPDALDAARGMGYGRFGLLWHIELPLALPGILTGIRLAAVSTVALVTVGVVIGQGGLGELIISGFRNNFYRAQISTGVVLCVLLAFAFDVVLSLAGRMLTPWTRRGNG